MSFEKTVLGQTAQNMTSNSSQNANSSNSLQQRPSLSVVVGDIYGIIAFVSFTLALLRIWILKSGIRAGLGIALVLISGVIWLQPDSGSSGGQLVSFILILVALAIVLSGIKKKRERRRRYFSTSVREQVLKNQKYRCTSCDVSISGALINFDHINGNRSDNAISNCQALCSNCHSQKTEDDREKQ
jgi:HNH endonuclease